MTSEIPSQFDVFLCHNSKDKPEIKKIAHELQAQGLSPWLDEWELRPGLSWQELLEEQIKRIHSAGVFVGSDGIGPWQNREMRAFLSEFVDRECPVIPVLLANAPSQPDLPIFLKTMTWVDFRRADPDPMARLVWGITGKKPPKTGEIKLKSERGIDYTKLQDLLKQHEWKEADAETARIMLQVANLTEEGWLRVEDIDNFPCEDLRTIDQLWVKYSNGRFGFSVQAKIYRDLGGTREYNEKIWNAFGDRVGWRQGLPLMKQWIYYKDVTFDLKAPRGHLPGVMDGDLELRFKNGVLSVFRWGMGGRDEEVSSLASRLVKCNLIKVTADF